MEKYSIIIVGLILFGWITWKLFLIDWGPNGGAIWFGLFFIGLFFVYNFYTFITSLLSIIQESVRYSKYQNSQLRFQKFPFFLGGKIKGQVTHLPKEFSQMTLDLRFIEEVHDLVNAAAFENHFNFRFFQLYKETKVLESFPSIWDGTLHID